MQKLIDAVRAARAVGTPILAITTPDQPALVETLVKALNGTAPAVQWDRSRGLRPLNEAGKNALAALAMTADELQGATPKAHVAMDVAQKLPAHTILFALNLPRFFREEEQGETIQAVANLRDPFKGNGRTLVMVSATIDLPPEIRNHVVLLDDPLPDDEQYAVIARDLHQGLTDQRGKKNAPPPPDEVIKRATQAVRGLSAFEAEQVLAMSMALAKKPGEVDVDAAWGLKIRAVEKTPGLSMTLSGPPLTDLRGLNEIIKDLQALGSGPLAPSLYVRVDEVDKALAGLGGRGAPGESTGTTQDAHEQFLTQMETNGWTGGIFFGVRGSGKTVLTQAIGAAQGVPTIAMDLGSMKHKHLGESEQNIREAFRMIKSIGGSRVCVLATCNEMAVLRPEFLRRFKLGIYYFDLLTAEERNALWPIYLAKYHLRLDAERPEDEGWTGAEIRNACELAYALGRPVAEIGRTKIVPVTKSDPNGIETMRQQAEGRYLSVTQPGVFRREPDVLPTSRRAFAVRGGAT